MKLGKDYLCEAPCISNTLSWQDDAFTYFIVPNQDGQNIKIRYRNEVEQGVTSFILNTYNENNRKLREWFIAFGIALTSGGVIGLINFLSNKKKTGINKFQKKEEKYYCNLCSRNHYYGSSIGNKHIDNYDSQTNNENVKDLISKLEFMAMLMVFLVTVINLFFRIYGPELADKVSFKYTLSIIFYLAAYLAVHHHAKYLSKNKKTLKFLNNLILLNIVLFIIWLFMLVMLEYVDNLNNMFEIIYAESYKIVSFVTLLIVPFIIAISFIYVKLIKSLLGLCKL